MDFKEIHVENSIVWGNSPVQLSGELTFTEVTNSIVEGGYPGVDNLDMDPLFIEASLGNYRLLKESPGIDNGSTSGPEFDLEWNSRPVDTIGIGREGEDAFDIGAYEFQDLPTPTPTITPTPTPTYPSDINLDGTVNAEDLLILLEDWGRVSGAR
jgi:hypothetical protein